MVSHIGAKRWWPEQRGRGKRKKEKEGGREKESEVLEGFIFPYSVHPLFQKMLGK